MNRAQAYTLVQQTFTQAFDKKRFANFSRELVNRLDESKAAAWNSQYVKDAFKGHVQRYERLGTYTSPDQETLDVLVVHLTTDSKLERARTALRNFVADHLKTRDEKDAALVAFVSPSESTWRFSYVKMEYATVEKDSGKACPEQSRRIGVETRLTPARRFSYIVGEGESCHTAQTRFLGLLQDTETDPTLADIEEAFSVEAVTKEFFTKYVELFGKIHEALEKLAAKDNAIRDEFSARGVNTVDFAKKLMGQIVFLYFLQKKGWLGVARGQDWGSGPRDFLRRLAKGEYGPYANFFNDILEPLFYDELATDRGHAAWSQRFNCRIPFLNGGLFEPLGDYDWRKTDIILPDKLFTNKEFVEEGITGTGVLDVFDRYNFTVNEAEPLEKEVAIDPEMLGKVFENLIEDNRRKGLGAYYTPREIVHYMCQESLINYLAQTCEVSETSQVLVPRTDIETFVHLGEQISHYEAVETKYHIKMPDSIQTHARLIDEKLAEITICDPAVGSGAFPVGMMTEIVRARSALTPYFNDFHERTPYHFKRHAIQNCLYGVDIDPGAVEIAKLRLWLSLVVDEEDQRQIKPLPNLDYKIVAGNSLLGFPFKSQKMGEIEKLKDKLFDETDHAKKAELKAQVDRLLAECFAASKKSLGYEVNFDFQIYFSEVFREKGGFDIVIGNPPYVVSNDKLLRKIFQESIYGRPNLYGFFIHRGIVSLLRSEGVLVFINPRTLLTDAYTSALRRFILKNSRVRLVLNIVDRRNVFESVLQSTIVDIFQRTRADIPIRVKSIKTKEDLERSTEVDISSSDFLFGDSAPIFVVAADANAYGIFRRIKSLKSFEQVGLSFTTGKIQWDLCKDVLSDRQTSGSTRLIWAENIQRYRIGENRSRVDKLYINAPLRNCTPITDKTIVVQRVTAVEQPWRIIATLISPKDFGVPIQSENHTSYLEGNSGRLDLRFVLGLMSSSLFDFLFRHINSNTQVSAGELNSLPFPKSNHEYKEQVIALVDHILSAKKRDSDADTTALEREIDQLVYQLYGLTPEEIAVVEGGLDHE